MNAWLKTARESLGISQENVASKCAVTRQYYNFIENGERRPSVETAKKIAAVLGFPWTRFFEEQEGGEESADDGRDSSLRSE